MPYVGLPRSHTIILFDIILLLLPVGMYNNIILWKKIIIIIIMKYCHKARLFVCTRIILFFFYKKTHTLAHLYSHNNNMALYSIRCRVVSLWHESDHENNSNNSAERSIANGSFVSRFPTNTTMYIQYDIIINMIPAL